MATESAHLSLELGEFVQSGFSRWMTDEQPVFEAMKPLPEPPVGGFDVAVGTQQ